MMREGGKSGHACTSVLMMKTQQMMNFKVNEIKKELLFNTLSLNSRYLSYLSRAVVGVLQSTFQTII